MIASLMAFLRRHIVMFGIVKFCAELVIGFGSGVCFLPSLELKKAMIKPRLQPRLTVRFAAAHLCGICRGQTACIGVMG